LAKKGSWGTLSARRNSVRNSRLPVKGNYKMIRLNPEVPGLLEFILNTPEIAANTIKAEQSILLVPENQIGPPAQTRERRRLLPLRP